MLLIQKGGYHMTDKISAAFSALRGRSVSVIGIGVSNTPLIELLLLHGATVHAHDRKERTDLGEIAEQLLARGVSLPLGPSYLDELPGDLVIKTPGLRFDHPSLLRASAAGKEVSSEMALFFALCPCPIVGITGSDGKTTTSTLIAELLKASGRRVHLGGNIGRPLLPIVADIDARDIAVLELSSFQLHTLRQSPGRALLTNLSPNHLDMHKDMAEYVDAKANLLRFQSPDGIAVLNRGCAESMALAPLCPGHIRFFDAKNKDGAAVYLENDHICADLPGLVGPLFARADMALPGMHNVENMMAAIATVGDLVGKEAIAAVARGFSGVPHRIEHVATIDGVRYYNDSIASSPSRAMAALAAFEAPILLIAGGYDKNLPFDSLARANFARVKTPLLMGATPDKKQAAIRAADGFEEGKPTILRASDLDEALRLAQQSAKTGDVVTLSPACASFDRYENFEARGAHFKALVATMKEEFDAKPRN